MPQNWQHGEIETVVRKHVGWVHACACRRVGNEAMAEDVTQAVFILFWRKWGRLGKEVKLTGWLYRAVRYCAARALRVKRIRERHEREAAMAGLQEKAAGEASWSEVSPELEAAVDRLGERDRSAVLLRFYRQMSFAEVGQALGISEDAAQKRVQRAVGKLQEMLGKKGVTGTTAGLSAVLVGNVVGQMPEHLVERIVSAVGSGGGNTVAAGIAKGAMKIMGMAKVKVVIGGLMLICGGLVLAAAVTSSPSTAPAGQASTAATTGDGTGSSAVVATLSRREQSIKSMRLHIEAVSVEMTADPRSVRNRLEEAIGANDLDAVTHALGPVGSRPPVRRHVDRLEKDGKFSTRIAWDDGDQLIQYNDKERYIEYEPRNAQVDVYAASKGDRVFQWSPDQFGITTRSVLVSPLVSATSSDHGYVIEFRTAPNTVTRLEYTGDLVPKRIDEVVGGKIVSELHCVGKQRVGDYTFPQGSIRISRGGANTYNVDVYVVSELNVNENTAVEAPKLPYSAVLVDHRLGREPIASRLIESEDAVLQQMMDRNEEQKER